MKTILHLLFLSALFVLTSCGAQKTAATLVVNTAAISASNSTFEGGLVIMGKSGDKNFTIPVSLSGSSNSVKIELTKGTWTFSAIGWDSVSSPFAGLQFCDIATFNINQDSQTVNLKLAPNKCFNGDFGSANYHNGVATFFPFSVITCGWLYENDLASTPVSLGTPQDFCQSTATPALSTEHRIHASSVKIEVPNIVNGVQTSGMSYCYPPGNEGLFTGNPRIPTKGLPLIVTLYDVPGCNPIEKRDIRGEYYFPAGIEFNVPEHDTFINAQNTNVNLFLPSNRTKRGYSSFIGIQPEVQCSGAQCTPALPPSLPGSVDLMIEPKREFVVIDNAGPTHTCSNISALTPVPNFLSTAFNRTTDCRIEDGKMFINLDFTTLSAATITLTWIDGTTQVARNVTRNGTGRSYELLIRSFGYPQTGTDPVAEIKNTFGYLDMDKLKHGFLSGPRDILDAEGPAGLLGQFVSCASGATAEKMVSFYDDDGWATYNVIYRDSDKVVTSDEADGPNPLNTAYDKKIIMQKKDANGVFNTVETIDFMCNYKIGIYEANETKGEWTNQSIVKFNTEDPLNSKSVLYFVTKRVLGGAIADYHSEIIKAGNIPTFSNKAQSNRYSLDLRNTGGSNYQYNSKKEQAYVLAGGYIRYIDAVDSQTFSGTNAAFSTAIAGATPGTPVCASQTTAGLQEVSDSTNCITYPASFPGGFTWSYLLPANIESASGMTPAATFTALD